MSSQVRAVPASLFEAHVVARRQRPGRDADPELWVAFHRRNVEIYAQVATVDSRHRHEATQYAGIEDRRALAIEQQLRTARDGER